MWDTKVRKNIETETEQGTKSRFHYLWVQATSNFSPYILCIPFSRLNYSNTMPYQPSDQKAEGTNLTNQVEV